MRSRSPSKAKVPGPSQRTVCCKLSGWKERTLTRSYKPGAMGALTSQPPPPNSSHNPVSAVVGIGCSKPPIEVIPTLVLVDFDDIPPLVHAVVNARAETVVELQRPGAGLNSSLRVAAEEEDNGERGSRGGAMGSSNGCVAAGRGNERSDGDRAMVEA